MIMSIRKMISCILSTAILTGTVFTGGTSLSIAASEVEKKSITRLTADFSTLPDGEVKDGVTVTGNKDTDTINYLNERFAFYVFQDLSHAWGSTQLAQETRRVYFERNNVNGYITDINNGVGRFPDTAEITDWSIDGITSLGGGVFHLNGADKIPTWTIDGKYIHCTAFSGTDNYNFRQENIMYFRDNTPTTLAVFKNFELTMNFMFKTESELNGTNAQDSVAVVFDSITAGDLFDKKYSVFTATPDGKYYLGSFDNYWQLPQHTMQLTDDSGNNASFERGKEYKLTIRRVAKNMTVEFTDTETDKSVAVVNETNLPIILQNQGGYVGITGSNAGAKYADISMTRLNDNGEAVDYGCSVNGYDFGVSAQELTDYRSHLRSSGTLNDKWNIWGFRNQNDKYGLYPYNLNNQSVFVNDQNRIWLGTSDSTKAVSDYLDKYFSVYYEGVLSNNYYSGKADHFWQRPNTDGMNLSCYYSEIDLYAYCHDTAPMIRVFSNLDANGLLSDVRTFVPKKSNGTGIYTENFETRLSLKLESSGNANRATALSFRSDKAGAMLDGTNAGIGYNNKVTVLFSDRGWKLYDGSAVPTNGDTYNAWDDNDTAGGDVDVYVKAVGSSIAIKVTRISDGKVLLNTTETVNTIGEGYLYYSACNENGMFYSFDCNTLDSDGNVTDWNTDTIHSLYEENKLLPIGHSAVVDNALQMDWTNSGFEISGNISGELKIETVREDNAGFVNVIIDGANPLKVNVPVGTTTITVASELTAGEHTVRVLSGTSPSFGTLTVTDIIYNGELKKHIADSSKIRMMAIGDSITAGFGINGKNNDSIEIANKIATSDGYYSYAAIAARTLGAEIDTVAKEGAPISEVHENVNKLNRRDGAPNWDWKTNQNDIIIINLGTNDEWISGKTEETALADAKALLEDMRAKNPDAYIIWIYGMMRKEYATSYTGAVQYMNQKGDSKVFSLEMTANTEALEGHPSANAHTEYAAQLVTFIHNNCSDIVNASTKKETFKELYNKGIIAFNGRSKWDNDCISSHYGSAGFTVSGYIYGDFILNCAHTNENIVRLDVILDGDTENMKTIELSADFNGNVTLIENLTRGKHTIQIRRASSDWGTTTYKSITYSGILEKPETKSLRMEFIGDSITVGEGSYGSFDINDGKNFVLYQNSMTGYAAQTATLLDADFSMLARCGVTTSQMLDDYNKANIDGYVNDGGRKDIVVINLGTNDIGLPTTCDESALKTTINSLIDAVIAKNGDDVCIVWAYGMMKTKGLEVIKSTIEDKAEAGKNIWFCDLSSAKNNEGHGDHPSLAGHTAAARILSKFINENCMPVVANGDVNLDSVTDIRDLVRFKKYFSNIDVALAKQKADINLDKVIDAADMVSLRKLLLGIE